MKMKNKLLRLPLLIALLLPAFLAAQTPVVLAPVPQFQAWTSSGLPLAFGCVFSFQSQTSNPLATYTDFTGLYQNPNPVILSASGTANIWIKAGQAYTLVVKTTGGTNCSLGTTRYTIDGIGGGLTTLTTVVTPSGGSATFSDQSQVQLFTLLLTGNVVGQPITAVGIIPPGLITFQITQDGVGAHTFSWPANTVGGATICPTANCVTTQTFLWNGTNATAIGLATYSIGPAFAATDLYDYGLSASLPLCTDANKKLASTCTGINQVTYNGQTVALGASGNVNAGAAAHSVALNQGNGAALTGLALGAHQIAVGQAGADPVAKTVPDCPTGALNYTQSGDTVGCGSTVSVISYTRKNLSGTVTVSANTTTTVVTQAVTMPSSGCPCRAHVDWSMYLDTTSSGAFDGNVNDGTATFATSETATPGSASNFGVNGSGWSTVTYANNAAITFTLQTRSNDTGYNVHQSAHSLVATTGMDITIQSSN
jgi:hypothetical protein